MKHNAIHQSFQTQVTIWTLEPKEKFLGLNEQIMSYQFGLAPLESGTGEYSNFKVLTTFQVHNETNGLVFKGETLKMFNIRIEKLPPTVYYLFGFADLATADFAFIFYERTKGTNLEGRQIAKPRIEDVRKQLMQSLNHVYKSC